MQERTYTMSQEFMYYSETDLSSYAGKWVAILGEKVIASGDDFKEVYKKAKAVAKDKEPLFTRIPKEEETLIL